MGMDITVIYPKDRGFLPSEHALKRLKELEREGKLAVLLGFGLEETGFRATAQLVETKATWPKGESYFSVLGLLLPNPFAEKSITTRFAVKILGGVRPELKGGTTVYTPMVEEAKLREVSELVGTEMVHHAFRWH